MSRPAHNSDQDSMVRFNIQRPERPLPRHRAYLHRQEAAGSTKLIENQFKYPIPALTQKHTHPARPLGPPARRPEGPLHCALWACNRPGTNARRACSPYDRRASALHFRRA